MSQSWKIVAAVVITAILAGGGVYLWQQSEKDIQIPVADIAPNYNPSAIEPAPAEGKVAVLYEDDDYSLRFTAPKSCADFYKIETADLNLNEIRSYGVFVPGSKSWPTDAPWYYFSLYTQEAYDQFDPLELPGKPQIELRLASGDLLTSWNPQDGPNEASLDCLVEAEEF